MRTRQLPLFCSLLAGLLVGGCQNWLGGLVTTRIVVRGQSQSLREQVLGSYERMGTQVYALAGVRSVDPVSGEVRPPPEMTDSRQQALAARRRMEFNRDDVRWFRREGYVGESYEGRLVVLPAPTEELEQENPWLHGLVSDVVEQENTDRAAIVERILETTPELEGRSGRRTVWRILARRYQGEAEAQTMIQREDGTWVRKKGGGAG